MMDDRRLENIINLVRSLNLKEEMMTTGFTGADNPEGPKAGYDKPLGMMKRKCLAKGKMPGARTRWRKGLG
jgi:hypothetical protein